MLLSLLTNFVSIKCTVLSYVWPRLDANVSKQRNHLSKSVFSVHPKTGRVCVPLIGLRHAFLPRECPHVRDLADGVEESVAIFKSACQLHTTGRQLGQCKGQEICFWKEM